MSQNRQLSLLAHNIRSLWNVGSLFRTADAMNVNKIYLTGYTATPPRREISKTAIGAEEWVSWNHSPEPFDIIDTLKSEGWTIVGLELTPEATTISDYNAPEKVCLVIGHEITGVPQELLSLCDNIVSIPMHGKKESLNVSVAAGIALHHLRNT